MKLKSLIYFFCALLLSIILMGEKSVISFSLNSRQNPELTNPKTVYISQENSRQTVSSRVICTPQGCYEESRGDQIMVISPSQGEYLLNNRPTVSLFSQQNGEKYVIKFENSKGILCKFMFENDQILDGRINIPYPPDKPSLQDQDGTISVTIETEKKRTRRNFKVVNKQEDIQNQVDNLKNTTSDLDKTLAVANFYLDKNFITEAINTLENAIEEERDLFSIYLQLGQLYLEKVRVVSLAQENYLQALDKAETAGNLPNKNQIYALIGLAKSNLQLQNLPKAIAYLQEAYNISRQLNDLGLIAQIEQFLGETHRDLGKEGEAINWYQKARDGYEQLGAEKYQKAMEEQL